MKLYRYWAFSDRVITDQKKHVWEIRQWGGSNDNAEDAEQNAKSAVGRLAERLLSRGDFFARMGRDDYSYGLHSMPEELVEMVAGESGITRNRQGCLVLNTDSLMFIDVDFPRLTFGQRIGKLFGRKPPAPQDAPLAKLKEWLARHRDVGVRVYRTKAGLRYMFTDSPRTTDATALAWLDELESDRLYRRLCKAQQCFRARLTPKPYRLKIGSVPNRFPRKNAIEQATFDKWCGEYDRQSNGYAVCSLIEHVGNKQTHPDLELLVARHDEMCRVHSSLPLA
jgi:hypothetical protein